jgi:monoamine oxidase
VVKSGDMLDQFTAEPVVCTIPFLALRRIDIDPPLSPPEREVVSSLEYSPLTRVYLQVSRRFWEVEGVTGGAFTDLPIGQV